MLRVSPRGHKRLHRLGNGYGVAWYPEVELDDDELDVVVDVKLVDEDGHLVIERFTAQRRPGGPPVTIDILKSMPMVGITAACAVDVGELGGLVRVSPEGYWKVADVDELDELPEPERVALIYRYGYFVGYPPTRTVAEAFGLTHAVAAKRVQAARRAGLLEPTTKGKKGA